MYGPVVLDLHPGLHRFVEEGERQLRVAVQHRQQPPLDRPPEGLLLAVLVGAIRQGPLVNDPQAQQTLRDFIGHHGRAIIGHQRPGQATLLKRLR